MYRSSLSRPVSMTIAGLVATSAQNIPSSAWAQLTVQALYLSTIGDLVPSTSANSITITSTGIYLLTAGCGYVSAGADTNRRLVAVYVNGTERARTETGYAASWAQDIGTVLPLVAGDVFTGWTYQNSGAALATAPNSSPTFLIAERLA